MIDSRVQGAPTRLNTCYELLPQGTVIEALAVAGRRLNAKYLSV